MGPSEKMSGLKKMFAFFAISPKKYKDFTSYFLPFSKEGFCLSKFIGNFAISYKKISKLFVVKTLLAVKVEVKIFTYPQFYV